MRTHGRLSKLERFLSTFTDIRAGEGETGLLLFADVFLVLCAYYFLKPLRDGWLAVSPVAGLSPMEVKAYSSFAQSLLLAAVANVFAVLATRLSRRALVTRSTLFCMGSLVVFWALHAGLLGKDLPFAGIAFYLWVGMFSLFVVAQFWTLAADLYAGERGTRLLPFIAIGATSGAAFGSWLTGALLDGGWLDGGTLLLLANAPLGASILLARAADARGPVGEGRARDDAPALSAPGDPRDRSGALRYIAGHPYLLAVGLVVMLANWVNTNGENLLFRVIQESLAVRAAEQGVTGAAAVKDFVRAQTTLFYGGFFFWVNTLALFAQAFVASRLLRHGGFAPLLLMLPTIALVSYSTMALMPVLAVVRVLKIAENATDYSINNTARQVLWLPTGSEARFRAKPAIDSLFVRFGDGCAALTVLVGVHVLDLPLDALFAVNVALVLAWLAASLRIVRDYRRLSDAAARGVAA